MALLFLAVFFLVNAICHFADTEYGRRNDMEDAERKRYRKWIGVGYIGLTVASVVVFIAETIYRVKLDSVKGVLCICLPYALPLLYILWVNARFHLWTWKKMRKRHIYMAFGCVIALFFVGTGIYQFTGRGASETAPFSEDALTMEREILSAFPDDTGNMTHIASLRISNPKGGYDELWLQEDTVICGGDGERLDFVDLKEGQSIRATVCPDVLYDALVLETGAVEINIYFRCYKIIIVE